MIEFIEHSETKLKFVSYSITTSIAYLTVLFLLVPVLYFSIYLSPIESSLHCHKTFLNRVDCQLEERSLLNSQLTRTDIFDLKKAFRSHTFSSRDLRIRLKATPEPFSFNTFGYQKTYYFPSNPFSLVLFRAFNPFNWFNEVDRIGLIDRFIRGKLDRKSLLVEQSFSWIDWLFFGSIFIGIPLLFICRIILWFFTGSWKITYKFDRESKTLTVHLKNLLGRVVEKRYDFERIKQVKWDTNYKTNFNKGRIILEFNPSYDYLLDEFADVERGVENFQIIKNFIED